MKCFRYWPNDHNETLKFENIEVRLVSMETHPDFIIRKIVLKTTKSDFFDENNNKVRPEFTFTQIHMVNWPDHGIPDNVDSIVDIIELIKRTHPPQTNPRSSTSSKAYLGVHCSAGCGRTGTLIAIDYCHNLIYGNKLSPDTFNPLEIAKSLRSQRIAMIQTVDQYELFYQILERLFRNYLHENNEPDTDDYHLAKRVAECYVHARISDTNLTSDEPFDITNENHREKLKLNLSASSEASDKLNEDTGTLESSRSSEGRPIRRYNLSLREPDRRAFLDKIARPLGSAFLPDTPLGSSVGGASDSIFGDSDAGMYASFQSGSFKAKPKIFDLNSRPMRAEFHENLTPDMTPLSTPQAPQTPRSELRSQAMRIFDFSCADKLTHSVDGALDAVNRRRNREHELQLKPTTLVINPPGRFKYRNSLKNSNNVISGAAVGSSEANPAVLVADLKGAGAGNAPDVSAKNFDPLREYEKISIVNKEADGVNDELSSVENAENEDKLGEIGQRDREKESGEFGLRFWCSECEF